MLLKTHSSSNMTPKAHNFVSRPGYLAITPKSQKNNTPSNKNIQNYNKEDRISDGKHSYQINGSEIGRGAFGVVYQAFNVDTGDFVAVKRFPIKSIPVESLASIESEIDLMRELNHPNIVKYISTVRSKNYLYIIMEYMENGSLSNVIKQYGSFSESLTAIYITQVLRGLSYLHDQGVLHRDIKGANILTTKEGHVKLADFGVAMKLSEASLEEQEAVGTPYWMAPEIIENTPTTACDIWSVGCTVIELLTSRPPYHDLDPLSAVFHIVQDDHPPLPKGISDTVQEFLFLCFKKEPILRPSADELLQHPWLKNHTVVDSELEDSVSELENSVANTIRMFRRNSLSYSTDHISPSKSTNSEISTISAIRSPMPKSRISSSKNSQASLFTFDDNDIMLSNASYLSMASKSVKWPDTNNTAVNDSLKSIDEVEEDEELTPRQHHSSNHSSHNMANNKLTITNNIANNSTNNQTNNQTTNLSNNYHTSTKTNDNKSSNQIQKSIMKPKLSIALVNDPFIDIPTIDSKGVFISNSTSDSNELDDDSSTTSSAHKRSNFLSALGSLDENDYDIASQPITPRDDNEPTRNRSLSDPLSRFHISSINSIVTSPIANKSMYIEETSSTINRSSQIIHTKSYILKEIDKHLNNQIDFQIENQQNRQYFDSIQITKKLETISDDSSTNLQSSPRIKSTNKTVNSGIISSNSINKISVDIPTLQTNLSCETSSSSNLGPAVNLDDFLYSSRSSMILSESSSSNSLTNSNKLALQILNRTNSSNLLETVVDDIKKDDEKLDSNITDNDNNLINSQVNTSKDSDLSNITSSSSNANPITISTNQSNYHTNKNKDIKLRNIKDIHTLICQIKPNMVDEALTSVCDQLITIFTADNEQCLQYINHYSLLPIVELIDLDTTNIKYPILCLINVIISNNNKVLEEMCLLGILPIIMKVIEKGCLNSLQLFSSSLTIASDQITASLLSIWPSAFQPLPPATLDIIIIEASKLIYNIVKSSLDTLQYIVISGGLNLFVHMLSLSSLIIRPNPMKTIAAAYAIAIKNERHNKYNQNNIFTTFNDINHPFRFIISNVSNNNLNKSTISSEQVVATTNLTRQNSNNNMTPHLANNTSNYTISEDAKTIVYIGIDCITQIFSIQSLKKRDYCRLFVKYGIIPHLASTFFNIMTLYHKVYINEYHNMNSSINQHSSTITITDDLSPHNKLPDSPPRYVVKLNSPINYKNAADDTIEYKYALSIATILFNLSRYESMVDSMAKNDVGGVLWVILLFLHSPELRIPLDEYIKQQPTHFYFPNNNSITDKPVDKPIDNTSTASPTNRILISKPYMDIILLLLKCLKNLSMEPSTLLDLEKAGTIVTLVPLLNGPISTKCKNQVLPCIFNLCRINKRRQEQAALLGIIPHLKEVISDRQESQLRQFALPLICSLAHTSPATRLELCKYDGVLFFLELLQENYWQNFVFNSIATWIGYDTEYVQSILIQPNNLSKLIEFFRNSSPQTIQTVHKPWLDMMLKSPSLCRALSMSGLFVTALIKRLNQAEAIVLCSLLKIIQLLHLCHPSSRQFVLDYDLYNIVKKFTKIESQVVVYQVANRLLADFQLSTMT